MSLSENSSKTISKTEIQDLDNYLKSLLNDLDQKVAVLESLSPPRSNNSSPQEYTSYHDGSCTIQYTAEEDICNPDITNVVAYEEAETTEQQPVAYCTSKNLDNDRTLSDEFSSINSAVTLFSPVEPDNSSKICLSNKGINCSLNSISSIDTLARPSLNETGQLICDDLGVACSKLDGIPFHLFDVSKLNESTTGYMDLSSRSAAYYGEHPYMYSGVCHPARPYSDNKYLQHILSYVQIVLPELKFNSAMVHRYNDGNCIMPQHSDNEECIEHDSQIVTISLGDTRDMEFKNKRSGSVDHVPMIHGEVLVMSKASQKHFLHAIPASLSRDMRISVTLRLIKPPIPNIEEAETINSPQSSVTDFLYQLGGNENPIQFQQEPNQSLYEPPEGYQDEPSEGYQDEPSEGYQYEPYQPLPPTPNSRFPLSNMQRQSQQTTGRAQVPDSISNSATYHNRPTTQYTWQREGWQPPHRSIPQRHWNSSSPSFPQDQLHPSRRTRPRNDDQFEPFANNRTDDIVFISSSMFADLNALKLSTEKIKSHVFFYRGADSTRMMEKLRMDKDVQNLARNKSISKVFLLTGTNNVDTICSQRQDMHNACSSITKTIKYVQSLFPSAVVNVINILPRVTHNRKVVIEKLNEHISSVCRNDNKLNFVDTYNIRLFTFPNGTRKAELFKYMYRNDTDNVHLNNYGIIKLAKHFKYLAHCK